MVNSLMFPTEPTAAKAKAVAPVELPKALPVIKPNKVTSATPWTDAMKTTGGRWEAPTIPAGSGYPASIGSIWSAPPTRNDLAATITPVKKKNLTGSNWLDHGGSGSQGGGGYSGSGRGGSYGGGHNT